jgi:hypothetical protein
MCPKTQSIAATAFLRRLSSKTKVAVCSGNHDSIDYLANTRVAAPLWLSELHGIKKLITDLLPCLVGSVDVRRHFSHNEVVNCCGVNRRFFSIQRRDWLDHRLFSRSVRSENQALSWGPHTKRVVFRLTEYFPIATARPYLARDGESRNETSWQDHLGSAILEV